MSDKIPDSTPPGAEESHKDSTPTSSTSDNVSRSHGPGERHPESTQTDNTSSLGASGHDLGARPKVRKSLTAPVYGIRDNTSSLEASGHDLGARPKERTRKFFEGLNRLDTEEGWRKMEQSIQQLTKELRESEEYMERPDTEEANRLFREILRKSTEEDMRKIKEDEFINDPLNFELYQKALSNGVEKDRSLRVNIVGNYNQGKTTLTKALLRQDITNIQSTNGVEINHCKYYESNEPVLFRLKSPSSNENEIERRIASLVQKEKDEKALNRKKVATVLTDSDDSDDSEYTNAFSDEKKISITTQLSKSTGKTSLTLQEFHNVSKMIVKNQFEKSEGDGDLQIWDFGGQYIFYATHTLLHSKESVYLMVFDLTKQLSDVIKDPEFPDECVGKNIQQYAEFWMNSIHTYVGSDDGLEPPVILVGTHKDQLPGDENMKEKIKDKYFEDIRKLFDDTIVIKHIQANDFAIDCTNPHDKSTAALREEIVRIGCKKERKVPARWITLEKSLLAKKRGKIILYSDIVAIDSKNEFPLEDRDNIKLFLLYHNAKGNLFYFDEEPISSYVILDTQYLIDAFRCIITSERFCKKDQALRPLWNILRQEARLEIDLLEEVWGTDVNNNFLEHKKELLMFLQRHYIISEALHFDEQTGATQGLGWYVVPCFLRAHSSDDVLKDFLGSSKQTKLRLAMSFNIAQVVQMVYYRLIAALIGKWPVVQVVTTKQEKKVLLYENLGAFRLDIHHVGIIEYHQNVIDLRVLKLCHSSSDINAAVVDKFRRFVEANVIDEVRKLRPASTKQNQPFHICYKCNDESHCLNGSKHTIALENLKKERVQPCPDMISGHEILTKDALSEWFLDYTTIHITYDDQLDDRQLSRVSQTIGRDWESLGLELGLTNVQLDHILEDYPTAQMRRFKMLQKWVDMKKETATFKTLIKAMKSTKGLSVDWDEVRNIVEEITSKKLQQRQMIFPDAFSDYTKKEALKKMCSFE